MVSILGVRRRIGYYINGNFVADLDTPLFTHHRGTLIVDIMCCPINHVSSITSRVDLLGGAGVYGPLQ